MKKVLVSFITAIMFLMPYSASAQFIPAGQEKALGSLNEQRDLDAVLAKIVSRSTPYQRQVDAVLADVSSKKLGQSAAQRKLDGIIGNLKTELTRILNDYTKKRPPQNNLRAAYQAGQDTLDSLRQRADQVFAEVGLQKTSTGGSSPTGKYLTYQQKIKGILDKGLAAADERLNDKGSRESVKKDLEKIVSDSQKQAEVATDGFVTSNGDVVVSAIIRIKKSLLDDFSTAMAERFKQADSRSNDKALDLPQDELEAVDAALKEVGDTVDRALNSIDTAMKTVAGQNLPTSNGVPGVNPLLEAKYKTQRQVKDIQEGALKRLDTMSKRFAARTDVSQLAKDVFAKAYEKEKNRLTDTIKEYNTYFLAGDPTKKQYNQRKEDIQDEAAGCTSFLCDIGRLASGVGSALIGKTTGINIPAGFFTKTLGINDPKNLPYGAYSGQGSTYQFLANVGGRYVTPTSYNGQGIPLNPACYNPTLNTPTILNLSPTPSLEPWKIALNNSLNNVFGQRYGYGSSVPCGYPSYGNPYGGLPIGQYLGFPSNNLGLNITSSQNASVQLLQGLQVLLGSGAVKNNDKSTRDAIQKVIDLLGQKGSILNVNDLVYINQTLGGTSFFNRLSDDAPKDTISRLFFGLCSNVMNAGDTLKDLCKTQLLVPIVGTPTATPAAPVVNPTQTDASRVDLATEKLRFAVALAKIDTKASCTMASAQNAATAARALFTELSTKYFDDGISNTSGTSLRDKLLTLQQGLNTYTDICKTPAAQPITLENNVDLAIKNLSTYQAAVARLGTNCSLLDIAKDMRSQIESIEEVLQIATQTDTSKLSYRITVTNLRTSLEQFIANCGKTNPTTQVAPPITSLSAGSVKTIIIDKDPKDSSPLTYAVTVQQGSTKVFDAEVVSVGVTKTKTVNLSSEASANVYKVFYRIEAENGIPSTSNIFNSYQIILQPGSTCYLNAPIRPSPTCGIVDPGSEPIQQVINVKYPGSLKP